MQRSWTIHPAGLGDAAAPPAVAVQWLVPGILARTGLTAFLDRRSMVKYLGDISWETEVWVADAPGHMIHFDGEKFLGPYSSS